MEVLSTDRPVAGGPQSLGVDWMKPNTQNEVQSPQKLQNNIDLTRETFLSFSHKALLPSNMASSS